jgi:hypothetical protein
MGLTAVLVDRARLIEKVAASAERVNKRTTYTTVTLPWFKARLTVPAAPEGAGPGAGSQRVEDRPSLIYGVKDSAGNEIELTGEMLVEVDSKQLGRAVYRIEGDPQPWRKKRRVIAHKIGLHRVEEHEVERPVA